MHFSSVCSTTETDELDAHNKSTAFQPGGIGTLPPNAETGLDAVSRQLVTRKVVHESTGFTPKELVSGQKVHGGVWVEIVQGRQTGKAEALLCLSTGKSEKKPPEGVEVHHLSPGDAVLGYITISGKALRSFSAVQQFSDLTNFI